MPYWIRRHEASWRPSRLGRPGRSVGAAGVALVGKHGDLAVDVQTRGAGALTWLVRVMGRETVLRCPDLSALPPGMALLLTDPTTGARRYLRTCPTVRVTLAEGERERV